MLFNNSFFGKIKNALIKSLYFQTNEEGQPLPPPTDYFLLDNSGENLLDNSGDPFITNEYP
jgi:hypothetical protein